MSLYVLTCMDGCVCGTFLHDKAIIIASHDKLQMMELSVHVFDKHIEFKSLKPHKVYKTIEITCRKKEVNIVMKIKALDFTTPHTIEYVNDLHTLHNIHLFIMDDFSYTDPILSLQGIDLELNHSTFIDMKIFFFFQVKLKI